MSNAGNFKIGVSDPYPVWCEISYLGERLISIRHDELSDLEYAVRKAMQQAKLKLPEKDRDEVNP